MIKIIILLILFCNNSFSYDWHHIMQINDGHVVDMGCWDSLNCFCLIQQPGSAELYKSNNAGKTWLLQYKTDYDSPQTKRFLNARQCISPNPNCFYIPSAEGSLIISTDGGANFKTIYLSDTSSIWNIVMKDSVNGLAITARSDVFIHRTFDGRQSSEKIISNTSVFDLLKEILDNGNVPMERGGSNEERTYFWSKFYDFNFNTFDFKEKNVFYIDSGYNHRDSFSDMSIINDSLYFMAGYRQTGVADYSSDIIYRTKDGGKSWEKVLDSLYHKEFGLQRIAFYDSKNGVAVGQYGKIVTTNDGGDTWVYNDLPPEMLDEEPLTMKVAWAGKTPIIGTWDGNMYRYEGDFFNFVPVPKPVNLIRPTNNAVKLKNDKAEFSWFSAEGYKKFYFQLSDSPDFAKFIRNDTLNTANLTVTNFESYSNYFWRVAFKFDKKVIWSDTYTFRTGLQKTTTSSPECGAKEQDFTVKFNWQSVKGAEKYRIRLSKNSKFGTITHEKDEILDLETEIPNLDDLTTYFWQVQPYRSDETGDWSNVCSFTTKKSTGVANNLTNDNILLNPNPASDYVTIQTSEVSKVQIFNTLGIEVAQTPPSVITGQTRASDLLRIDISHLPTGMYFVKIIGSNGACSIVEKFVKM